MSICKYISFPVIQTCNTFQKKLGQEQFRASNEVNWLNNDVIWNSWCQQVIVIMIWYKSSIQERSSPLGAKMGRGSPVCQQIREKIIEMFKNNVPQRKIGRDLDISPSTVHNIIKRFKESGGILVRKGQGRKPKLTTVISDPSGALHQESSFIYKRYHHMGSGLLWQTFVKFHNT